MTASLVIQTAFLGVWDVGQRTWAIGSAAVVLVAFGAGWWLSRRTLPRPALALGAALLAAVAIGAGYAEQDRYLERRYAEAPVPAYPVGQTTSGPGCGNASWNRFEKSACAAPLGRSAVP